MIKMIYITFILFDNFSLFYKIQNKKVYFFVYDLPMVLQLRLNTFNRFIFINYQLDFRRSEFYYNLDQIKYYLLSTFFNNTVIILRRFF